MALRQAATRALIAESIRRCQRGRCMHNPLPFAHDAYTSVTCTACAGVQRQEARQRLANGGAWSTSPALSASIRRRSGGFRALSFREARPPREAMRPSITERVGRN